MSLPADLHFFRWTELKHPELIEPEFAYFADQVRAVYDNPLVVTDDGRTPAEQAERQNALQGGSTGDSLHLHGRAFDVRWPASSALVARFLRAFYAVESDPKYRDRTELELDATTGNMHIHFGLRAVPPTSSTAIIRKAA